MTYRFAEELRCYGPNAGYKQPNLAEARAYCRRIARSHYENFVVGSLLLPRPLLTHFYAIYAYCRWADDLGDETGAAALELLDWWEAELRQMTAGQARHPVMIALAATQARFQIPLQLFHDLLSAFRQDQVVKNYATYAELLDYCRRSANPVGRMVLHLFGAANDKTYALSDSVCTGLQLANFWQDVARDHALGRVYLPAEDRRKFGYTEEDLAARRTNAAFQALLRFLVERARACLERGRELVRLVPAAVQPEVDLFTAGGLAILDRIEAMEYDTWRTRPRLGLWTQTILLLRTLRLPFVGSRCRPPMWLANGSPDDTRAISTMHS